MKKTLLILSFLAINFTQAQIVNIPDTNFKNTLLSANTSNNIAKDSNENQVVIDTNNDGEIQNSEAESIYYLDVSFKNINDLTGIEAFINLTTLRCSYNQLTSLDVSQITNLEWLWCYDNQLTNLDVSQNTNLIELICSYNQLTSLDVSQNTGLTNLSCGSNQLMSLDVSQNTNLHSLSCYYNQLSTLDVSQNTGLTNLSCFYNQLTSLDVSQNTNLHSLSCYYNQLSTLDVSQNTNLIELNCSYNQLTSLDVSQYPNLTYLDCSYNQLTSLDVSQNTNLTVLYCHDNQLTSLDVSQNTSLDWLFCGNNQLTTIDIYQCGELTRFKCNDNSGLSYINLKNGNNQNLIIDGDFLSNFENLPNLQTVCVDELNTNLTAFINTETGHSVTFTEYCSFEPAQSNVINGTTHIDLDLNGCDANDGNLANILITTTNGTDSFGTLTQSDGSFSIFTNEGGFNTSLTTNLPNYFTATPSSINNTFTGFDNTFTADFCVAPNQTINDVNISLIPTSQARPGFDTTYQIIYKNVGTTVLNGDVAINFEDSKLNFLNASETPNSQTSNSLTFNYTNLNPFETRTINLGFNVIAPPTVNVGDILSFTASINPITGDNTTDDNTFILNQTVIGSYDPNDITCLEGNQVLFAEADKYLHYIIRFQNTGTASAINVVVKNILDNHLDWSTLQLESLSHNNRVAIKNENEIEFIFENIDLPDNTTDESNSHGFVAYKIKPKADIALDDVILNKADIFFDYNSPIETNIASTRIVNVLAINENTLLDFSVYPTPTKNILNIKSKTEISKIEIYSKLGQLILKNETENNINISNITNGLYFVKVVDINGNFGVKKIMKK